MIQNNKLKMKQENKLTISKESLLAIGFEGMFDKQFKRVDGTCWTIYFIEGKLQLDDSDWISIDITKDITTIGQLELLFSSLQYKELNKEQEAQGSDTTKADSSN